MKDKTNITEALTMLESIQKVDVPPFLMTRIREKIKNDDQQMISTDWMWGLAASFTLIFALNVLVITNEVRYAKTSAVVESMNLNPSNTIYFINE